MPTKDTRHKLSTSLLKWSCSNYHKIKHIFSFFKFKYSEKQNKCAYILSFSVTHLYSWLKLFEEWSVNVTHLSKVLHMEHDSGISNVVNSNWCLSKKKQTCRNLLRITKKKIYSEKMLFQ